MDIWITGVKSCETVLTKIQPKFNKSGQIAHHLDLPNRIHSFVDRLIIGWSAFSNANWPIRCNSLRQCACLTEKTHGVSSSCNISFVAMMISWSFWVCCSVSRPFYGLLSSSSHSELWLLSTFVPYGSDIQIIWQQTRLSTGNRPSLSNSLHDSAAWERFLNSPVRSLLECKLAWLSWSESNALPWGTQPACMLKGSQSQSKLKQYETVTTSRLIPTGIQIWLEGNWQHFITFLHCLDVIVNIQGLQCNV